MVALASSDPDLYSAYFLNLLPSTNNFGITMNAITPSRPMDGIGGTIKNRVFRDVLSGKVNIGSAEHFASYANKIITGISSLYMPSNEVLTEPDCVENAPKIAGTLEFIKFEGLSTPTECVSLNSTSLPMMSPRSTRTWYRKEGDPEICDHLELPLSFDVSMTCAKCRGNYKKNEEWLECVICDQWFHEDCFYL